MFESPVVSSVTHDPNTVVIKLNPVPTGTRFLAGLFAELAEKGIVVDIITQSQTKRGQRLNFSIPADDLSQTELVLQSMLGPNVEVTTMKDMAKLSVIGVGMKNHPGVAARFFQSLERAKASIQLVTTSDIKISVVIPKAELAAAARDLHREFGLDTPG